MTTRTIKAIADGYVVDSVPTFKNPNATGVQVQLNERWGFFDFGQPVPLGWNVQSAYLRLYQVGVASGGSRTLSVRRISSAWKESELDYNHMPSVGTLTFSSSAQGNGGTSGRLWEIDVTSIMAAVSNGTPFYGFRLESDNATNMAVFSSESSIYRPELVLTLSARPLAPTILNPSGGRAVSIARPTVTFDFNDPNGDDLAYIQVQANPTNSFGAPALDTGALDADTPEYTWTSDIAVGDTTWWRVRVKDADGDWSPWSQPTYFVRTAKPTVSWVTPAGSTFTDPDIPSNVSLSAGTQSARQVFLYNETLTRKLYDSGKRATSTTSHGINGGYVPTPGVTYRLARRTWDNVARATTSGATEDPPYVHISKDVTYVTSGASPVTGLTAAVEDNGLPGIVLSWTDTPAATSQYLIVRDGRGYDIVDAADTLISGTSHEWTDTATGGRGTHEYTVYAVVSGVTKDASATVTGSNVPVGIWIRANGLAIQLTGDLTVEPNELSAVYSPVGAENQVVLKQARYGRKGELQGGALGDGSETLAELRSIESDWEDLLEYAEDNPVTIIETNRSIRAILYNTWTGFADESIVNNGGSFIPVGFSYVEQV